MSEILSSGWYQYSDIVGKYVLPQYQSKNRILHISYTKSCKKITINNNICDITINNFFNDKISFITGNKLSQINKKSHILFIENIVGHHNIKGRMFPLKNVDLDLEKLNYLLKNNIMVYIDEKDQSKDTNFLPLDCIKETINIGDIVFFEKSFLVYKGKEVVGVRNISNLLVNINDVYETIFFDGDGYQSKYSQNENKMLKCIKMTDEQKQKIMFFKLSTPLSSSFL